MVDDRGRQNTGLEMERAGQIWHGRVRKREANDNSLQRFDRQIGALSAGRPTDGGPKNRK